MGARGRLSKDGDIRILCYRAGFLGDICLSTSSLRGIKQKYPDCSITYGCWRQNVELIALNPYLDEIVSPGGYQSSDFDRLLDFRHESLMNDHQSTYWGKLHAMNAAEQGLLDLDKMGSYKPELYIGPDDVAEKVSEKPLAVFNVFSRNGLNWRLWEPFDKWAELVINLHRMGYKVVQIGGKDDPPVTGVDIQLCGQTRLAQIPGILAVADIFIGIDSFAHHVACGQKFTHNPETKEVKQIGDSTPTVLLAGPIPPECVVPTNARCSIASYYPDCDGACNHSFASKELPICTHKNSCMKELSVEMVLEKVEEIMNGASGRSQGRK